MEDRFRVMVLEKLKKTIPKRHLAPKDLIAFKHDKKFCVVEYPTEQTLWNKQSRIRRYLLINTWLCQAIFLCV